MMNKLTALFAMVIGLALVADVEAARPRRNRVAAPATEVVAPAAEVVAPAAEGDKDAKPGFFARGKAKAVAAKDWTKGQFVNHPYRSTAITAGTVAAVVVIAEAVKNGKNSWFPRAYRAMFAANKTNRLADVMAARQAAAQAN